MARSDLRRVVGVRAKLTGVLFALLASSPALAASVSEQWKAVSTAGISITGDITISADRIIFGNGTSLPLAAAGRVRDFTVDTEKPVVVALFRVTAPDNPVLPSGKRLCEGPAAPAGDLHCRLEAGAPWG